jgi:hypothetical protein
MNRKDDLAPTEIHEAMARAEQTCSAIACETDYEPPCLRGQCHPEHCLIVANEAVMLARTDEHEHEARQEGHEPEPRRRRHASRRHVTDEEGGLVPMMRSDVETRSWRYVMHAFAMESGSHVVRRGYAMRHLGDGGYMRIKKYP